LGGRGRQISEASLVYRVSSRTARAIQRNPVQTKKKKRKSVEININILGRFATCPNGLMFPNERYI
jgi:hypothetical protein